MNFLFPSLSLAIKNDSLDMFRSMTSSYASYPELRIKEKLFLLAAKCQAIDIMSYLISEHGVDVHTYLQSDYDSDFNHANGSLCGDAMSIMLSHSPNSKIYKHVDYLISKGYDLKRNDIALSQCVIRKDMALFDYLVGRGAQVEHSNALITALVHSYFDIAAVLLQKKVNIHREQGYALRLACSTTQCPHIIKSLIELGANVNQAPNHLRPELLHSNQSALVLATEAGQNTGNYPIISYLIEQGSNVDFNHHACMRQLTRHFKPNIPDHIQTLHLFLAQGCPESLIFSEGNQDCCAYYEQYTLDSQIANTATNHKTDKI